MPKAGIHYGAKFEAVEEFTVITCGKCGIPFGVPSRYKRELVKTGDRFYCPNGHCRVYIESTEDKLRKQLEQKESELQRERTGRWRAEEQRDAVRKSHRKMRERVKNGVCPYCNRTFQNFLNHMRTQHPEIGDPQALRQIRVSYGLTQHALAEEIGLANASYISLYECGKHVSEFAQDKIEAWLAEQGK